MKNFVKKVIRQYFLLSVQSNQFFRMTGDAWIDPSTGLGGKIK